MKPVAITTCFAILFFLSGFTAHEIKISTSEITLANSSIKIRIKLFADDLTSCLSQIAKKQVPFEGTSVDSKTLVLLNDYVKQNFMCSINNVNIHYRLVSSVIDNNQDMQLKTVELNYVADYKTGQSIKKCILKNTLLFDACPEQKNITKISLIPNKEAQTIIIENIKDETQKEITY